MKEHNAQSLAGAELSLAEEPATGRQRLGQILVEAGRLLPSDVDRILAHARSHGMRFGQAGLDMDLITPDDLRYGLSVQFDYPYLGADSPLAAELVAAHRPDSAQAEQWRALRSQLSLRWLALAPRPHALAVVSPDRSEGRSVSAANLAITFSHLGLRTLLIDADLRQPRQHELFRLGAVAGLSDLLAGRAGGEVIAAIAELRGLSVLPAGTPAPNPQELLARPAFSRLLDSLAQPFDLLVIDTPAAAHYADAQTVAARCGAALLMARQHSSSLPRLAQLSQGLHEFGVNLVGTVLHEA